MKTSGDAPETPGDSPGEVEIPWTYAPRVATDLLGSQKYPLSTRALAELVANALDAGATEVDVTLTLNDLGSPSRLEVRDNGRGMNVEDLRERFAVVGVDAPDVADATSRLGRFGIGRLAVHRIGSLSRWRTFARAATGELTQSNFVLNSNDPRAPLRVTCASATASDGTGTTIEIENLRDTGEAELSPQSIRSELLAQFCGYLLANRKQVIRVDGERLDIEDEVQRSERETLPPVEGLDSQALIDHIELRHATARTKLGGHLVFCSKGRTVAQHSPASPPSGAYLGIVECPYLDDVVTSGREALVEMDGRFTALRSAAVTAMDDYAKRQRLGAASAFIKQARGMPYYPYQSPPANALIEAKQALYDVVLEKMNEHAKVDGMTQRQQAVVFRLLKRALENEDLQAVLTEVAGLSDAEVEQFRVVLERATLGSIIKMSAEITSRLRFLDVLHEVVYGAPAKRVRERSQLHKIVESECWLFEARFFLATSDKSFRTIVQRHRELARLEGPESFDPSGTEDLKKIPDLFLAAQRSYPTEPRNHHLLVELKRPNVDLGTKERTQAEKYASIIAGSSQFDKLQTRWDIYLVSSRVKPEINQFRRQKDRPVGLLHDFENVRVWAFEWSELISRARDELQLVRQHIEAKSSELAVTSYLAENFPEILTDLRASGVVRTEAPESPKR